MDIHGPLQTRGETSKVKFKIAAQLLMHVRQVQKNDGQNESQTDAE